jgi:peroxiredoxin
MKSWLKQIAIFGVIFLIMSFAVDTWRTKDIDRQALPALQGMTINNEQVDLKALSFKQPVLVYFWGTWCPVCSVVSPSVNTISQYFPTYSIAMQSGDNETLKTYMDKEEYQFNVINDDDNRIAQSLGVQVTPLVMVIDQGELVNFTTGYVSLFGLWWRIAWASW